MDSSSAAKLDHSATLRAYAEQLPVVLSVPNLREALRDAADEIERLRDRAVCSGCGNDVGESGACSYPGCDDGEMIPAAELPLALREMRDRRDEWRQEAMSL